VPSTYIQFNDILSNPTSIFSSALACCSNSETSSPKYFNLKEEIPVPAGISLPIITFSFKP